jgi:hypothetical protein
MNSNEAGPSTAEPPPTDATAPPSTSVGEDSNPAFRHAPGRFYENSVLLSLDDLIRTLDLVVWAEIALVYFMEYVYLAEMTI